MVPVINNTAVQQFEAEVNGQKAHLVYRFYKGSIALMHTFVPKELEGMGIASALAKTAFA